MTISNKDLERKIKSLNDITDNKYGFTLESSYGGYKLASHKGSVDVFTIGLVSKKELWYHIDTFINGLTYEEYRNHLKTSYIKKDRTYNSDSMTCDQSDVMSQNTYCTECGENPTKIPQYTGSENWYEGECEKCDNLKAEFVFDMETPEQKACVPSNLTIGEQK